MFNYTKTQVIEISKQTNFITNTTEKVLRLYDILDFVNKSDIGNMLYLKGGTAINMCLLDFPRLSVDIDFDFDCICNQQQMLLHRNHIRDLISGYMIDEGYILTDRSKYTYTLDSYVWSYETLSNCHDVLKIEINYSNRTHLLESTISSSSDLISRSISIRRLSNDELIGSKVNALIIRTTPRDIYDVYNLLNSNQMSNKELIKKIAIFYLSLGCEKPIDIDMLINEAVKKVMLLNYNRARQSLLPVLHKSQKLDLARVDNQVINYLLEDFKLTANEKEYVNYFNNGTYKPDLLFDGEMVNDVTSHPMALWKIGK